MSKGIRLLKDTLIYAAGSFSSKIFAFLLLPLYTSYFSSDEYGHWDLVSSALFLLFPLISFEVYSAVYRWLLQEKEEDKRREIITTSFLFLLRNIIISSIIAYFIMTYTGFANPVLAILMFTTGILSDYILICVRGFGLNKQFAIIGILQTVIMIIANLVCIFILKLRIETFYIAAIASSLVGITTAWYTIRYHKYLDFKSYSGKLLKSFLKYSIPISFGAINWWVMNLSDRFFIANFMNISANGIYAISNKFATVISMASAIFSLAWQDNAIKNVDEEDRNAYYSNVFKQYFRFMTASCLILIASNRLIIGLTVNQQFAEAWKYAGFLYLGALFSSLAAFWGSGFQASKKTNIIFLSTLFGALVNLILNLIFIKSFGLFTVSVSTLLCYMIMWLYRLFGKDKGFDIIIEKKDMAVLFSLTFIILTLSFVQNKIIDAASIIISITVFILYNKDSLLKLLKHIPKKS